MTEDAFLAAIRERPDDATTRLVFADWLEERGETGRAAELRHGCRFRMPLTAKELRHLPLIAAARDATRAEDVTVRVDPESPNHATLETAALAEDVANLSPLAIARNFPRDDKGRLSTEAVVLLATYPPAVAPPAHRGWWLMAEGPERRSDPQTVVVNLALLIGENHLHNWSNARHYWDRRAAVPPAWGDDPERAKRCTALQDQGRFEDALRLCGVAFPPQLTRVLDAEAFPLPNDISIHWRLSAEARAAKLRRALWEAAPWRFREALANEQARLDRWVAEKPSRGHRTANGRLFIFPGSTASRKPGLRLTADPDGTPRLVIEATAANNVLPETTWKRPVELDVERLQPSSGRGLRSGEERSTPT